MSIHSLLHTSDATVRDPGPALGTLDVTKPPLDVGESADCCCATAQVRVVLPPVAGRNSRPELRLCAHHYRKASKGLSSAGADVYDARGHWIPSHEHYWIDPDSATSADTVSAPATRQPV